MATPASQKDLSTNRVARTTGNERSIGQIVSDAASNAQTLVRDEIALAKAEVSADVQKGAKTGAGFAVAGVFAAYGFGILLLAIGFALAMVLPNWAAFLIVAAVLFLIAAIAAFFGYSQMKKIKGKPERAISAADRTQQTLKAAANPNVTTPRS
ncbi:phage holin family protein [Kytococcus sp. Marseille-QA3725]